MKKQLVSLLMLAVLAVSPAAFADGGFTPHSLCSSNATCTFAYFFQNVGMSINMGMRIVYIIGALLGMVAVVAGLIKIRMHALDLQGTSRSASQAMYALIIGGMLIAIPSLTLLVTNTFFGDQGVQVVSEAQALNGPAPAHVVPVPAHIDPPSDDQTGGV